MGDPVVKLEGVDFEPKWLVRERVMVAWEDGVTGEMRYLGCLSDHNGGVSLTLAIGYDDREDRKLLTAFRLPIKLRPSSSHKPKDMYFIVPVEASLAVKVVHMNTLSTSELQEAGLVGSMGCSQRLIHALYTLREAGHVVMPQVKPTNATGRPRYLLEHLLSLSRSRSFEMYLKFNTYAQVELARISEKMCPGSGLITPTLNLQSMYGGSGAVNKWEQFGIHNTPSDKTPLNCVVGEREVDTQPPAYSLSQSSPQVLVLHSGSEPGSPLCKALLTSRSSPQSVVIETPPPPEHSSRKRKATSPIIAHPAPNKLDADADSLAVRQAQEDVLDRVDNEATHTRASSQPQEEQQLDMEVRLFTLFVQWLVSAWSILPSAHVRLQQELLAFGGAARAGNVRLFNAIRVECSARLVTLVAELNAAGSPAAATTHEPRTRDFAAEIRHVIRWVNAIYDAGDLVIPRDLVRLAEAAREVASSSPDRAAAAAEGAEEQGEEVEAADAFTRRKAICVARVCFLFGRADSIVLGEVAT